MHFGYAVLFIVLTFFYQLFECKIIYDVEYKNVLNSLEQNIENNLRNGNDQYCNLWNNKRLFKYLKAFSNVIWIIISIHIPISCTWILNEKFKVSSCLLTWMAIHLFDKKLIPLCCMIFYRFQCKMISMHRLIRCNLPFQLYPDLKSFMFQAWTISALKILLVDWTIFSQLHFYLITGRYKFCFDTIKLL